MVESRLLKPLPYWLLLASVAFSPLLSFPQTHDTLMLGEVEIRGSFTQRTEGFKKITIDSSLLIPQLNTDLSTILSQHSTVFIKTYGNGSLATPSMRGTTASHTQVEWNGISINSPMLGMTDFSQIPVFQFNDVEILYGAAGIAKTSGAFGGVINLVTNPDWNNRLNVIAAQTSGSFDTYSNNLGVGTGNEKLQSVTKVYYTFSKNNFKYNTGSGEKRQKNGEYEYVGGSEELFFKLSKKDYLGTRIWFNSSYINLPPTLTNENSGITEIQENNDLYGKVEWNHLGKRNLLTVWSGLVDHFMRYTSIDPQMTEENEHLSYSWLNRLRWSYSGLGRFLIKPGLDYNYDWVKSDAYSSNKSRGTLSAFSEFILRNEDVSFNLIIREDLMENKFLPLIIAFGAEYDVLPSHNLTLNLNFSKNYKYPTLNDLYWETFGNPNLKPETDYAQEAGLIYNFSLIGKKLFIETEVTGYFSRMEDLINWTPDETGKFRPSNVAEVWARGIESGLNFHLATKGWLVKLDNNYHYCRSTNEKPSSPQDASVGKQLIYIPVHTINSTLSINKSNYYFTLNYSWFSRRYTSTTNTSYMPAYGISNIILGKNFHLEEILLSLQLQINNLFDLDYQSIANRPMPGRNMAITLKINFGK